MFFTSPYTLTHRRPAGGGSCLRMRHRANYNRVVAKKKARYEVGLGGTNEKRGCIKKYELGLGTSAGSQLNTHHQASA